MVVEMVLHLRVGFAIAMRRGPPEADRRNMPFFSISQEFR